LGFLSGIKSTESEDPLFSTGKMLMSEPDPDVLNLITPAQARALACLPLRKSDEGVIIATARPEEAATISRLEALTGMRVRLVMVAEDALEQAIHRFYGKPQPPALRKETPKTEAAPDLPAAVRMQNLLLEHASNLGASDIHIEPHEDVTKVRYRVDGLLREGFDIPRWMHDSLVSRIKVISGMDIADKRIPQDGHIRATQAGGLELRIATLPTFWGESVVVRLLGRNRYLRGISQLGLGSLRSRITALIHRPQGIILLVGPTGSGKTTTLYAFINELKQKPLKIVTIEDPVECQVSGTTQVQINEKAGLTFHGVLRATLRQDPDVILVGEIRDSETARTAFNAALTGHLVLSTLHTTDTVSAILRLSELGISSYLASAATIAIISQRLLRLNCPYCLEPDFPQQFYLDRLGITDEQQSVLRRSEGCHHCQFSGASGRSSVFELLEVTPAIRQAIVSGSQITIQAAARAASMVPLIEQAVQQVLAGSISVEEAYRTCYFGETSDEG
jgi:type IV pilus assembly protein PilB